MAIVGTDMNSYFAHDANAREDARLMKLRREHGFEGIGIYWTLVEILRQSDGYKYLYDAELLADLLRIPDKASLIKSIIQDFSLFEAGEYFSSPDLDQNMRFMESKRQKQSAGGAAGAATTNFKLYGIIPDNWSDEEIAKQWEALNRDEQYRLTEAMSKPANKKHKDRLNNATS